MHPRSLIWTSVVVIWAGLAPPRADAAPPARTLDRVTYTAPERWKVDESTPGQVSISRIAGDSYCLVAIFASMPASASLEASFAAAWQNVALRTVAPVAAPVPTQGNVGNARAALGGAASTAGGKPVAAILIVIDAGASVVPILILTPSTEAFDAYSSDVQAMLGGLVVSRADNKAPPPPPASGNPVVPPPTRPITMADLAGEWKHEDGIMTRYVDRNTGAYAGFDSIAFRETWTINAKGVVTSDFFAIKNGRKIIEKTAGTMRIAGSILDVKIGSPAKFVVRGWLEGPEMTVLKICGPFYGEVPADVLAKPEQGSNLNQYWIRKAK
jgi:hypothetical protein